MKKIATLCLVLSVASFAANKKATPSKNKPTTAATGTTVIAKFNALEASYAKLVETENAEYERLVANAEKTSAELAEKIALKANIDEKIAKVEAASTTKVFKSEYDALVKEYRSVSKALDTEIKKLEAAVEKFNLVRSLRGGN